MTARSSARSKDLPAIFAGAAAVSAVVSIAASQIFLGLAILALAVNWREIRWPRAAWPLLAFVLWTLVSLAASPDPSGGMPQIKKFYVYLMLIAVYSTMSSAVHQRWLTYGWAAAGTGAALWGFVQGVQKFLAGDEYFYYSYSNDRITGFSSHWMTFSGLLMMVLLMTAALVLFAQDRRYAKWLTAACVLISLAILASFTRSMWVGTAVGAAWLLWAKDRRLVVLLPIGAALVLAIPPLRQRAIDAFQPRAGTVASAEHRSALRAVGIEMIRDHPLVGVGPEQVQKRFVEYSPQAGVPVPPPVDWYYAHLHNVYIHYAAERGIPAALAMIAFLGVALFDFARGLKHVSGESKWVLHGALACVLAIAVSAWFEVNLGDSEPLAMYLSVVGCGYSAMRGITDGITHGITHNGAPPPDRA